MQNDHDDKLNGEFSYRSFFENAVEGFFLSTPQGRFIAVNPALAVMLGYSGPEEMISELQDLKSQLYLTPLDRDRLFALLNEKGQVTDFETQFVCKDGSVKWISLAAREVRGSDGSLRFIEGLNIDITARKNAEMALRESEEKFRRTFDQAPIGAAMLDLNFSFVQVNKALCDITGYAEEELLSRRILDIIHPDDVSVGVGYASRLIKGEIDFYQNDRRFIHKDGGVLWVNISMRCLRDALGKPSYLLPMIQDITSRKNALDALEQYRLNLEAVLRSIPDAVLTVDKEMKIIHINRAMSDVCCISEKMVPGKSLTDFSGSCDRSCFHVLLKTLQTREPVIEYRIECTGSTPGKSFIINSSPLLDQDKRFMGAVLAIRDITRLTNLERQVTSPAGYRNIIGKSKVMQEIYGLIDLLTDVEATVLITGESGTGKELIAEALHYGGSRAKRPLVKVNCAALAESLLESELFGHVRGAFTGAVKDKIGRFEAAEGGTLFLDEIGDVALSTQIKLLRVLERKEYERVGDSMMRKADVRVIAATNADLGKQIRQGLFREDLYYRLKIMSIHLPPLREREQDIPLLCQHFINQLNVDYAKNVTRISDEVLRLFMQHSWPGNVRELRHALEHAFILCSGGEIRKEHLPKEFTQVVCMNSEEKVHKTKVTRDAIIDALTRNGGNKAKASRELGIDRRTLYRNLSKK
ncbi:MAG TPA: sigma 54-interacting transcriptional regulator [Dissulfurispiraceae bacterium]|nr:sigma 54-interacting transcriptional regulator [Dissulfurispiraceae bacterium]